MLDACVALLQDAPGVTVDDQDVTLLAGQVGRIIESKDADVVVVEFADSDRKAHAYASVARANLLFLKRGGLQVMARAAQKIANDQRRAKFAPVVLALRDPTRAKEVVVLASQQVKLWRSKSLCSLDYIEAWDDLLKRPLDAAAILEEDSPYAAQLRQNAPFVSILRKLTSGREEEEPVISHVTPTGGNIFADLGFEPEEAARLLAESDAKIDAALAAKGLPPRPQRK